MAGSFVEISIEISTNVRVFFGDAREWAR